MEGKINSNFFVWAAKTYGLQKINYFLF